MGQIKSDIFLVCNQKNELVFENWLFLKFITFLKMFREELAYNYDVQKLQACRANNVVNDGVLCIF